MKMNAKIMTKVYNKTCIYLYNAEQVKNGYHIILI